MFKKEFSHDDKVAYHNRRSWNYEKLGTRVTKEQVGYSRSWLLGADYADALTKNGSKPGKAKNDEYIKKIESNSNRSPGDAAFLTGFKSFMSLFKKDKK